MSKDPHSGIDLDYLLDHLPPDALTDWVDRETAAAGKKLRRSKYKHCPFPDHADSKPSFTVTEGKGWHCFGCTGPDGKGRRGTDVVSLVKQLRGYASMDDAIIEVATYYNITRPQSPRRKTPPEAPRGPRNAQELLDHLLSLPDHSALSASLHKALLSEDGEEARAYLEGRGIPQHLWTMHELGYVVPGSRPGAPLWSEWEGMVTFPIRVGEHVIGFTGRRIREEESAKLLTKGPKWPFNMNALLLDPESRPPVYLCEGPIDALALEEMGHKPAVALLGSEVLREWWPLFGSAVLVLDSDKGEEHSRAIARRMRRLLWSYRLLPPGMDPADVWKASGFSSSQARSLLAWTEWWEAEEAPPLELAFEAILSDPPDKRVVEGFAGAVAKNTPGLTLTLHYEDGPDLGHYLEFTRADGRALSSVIFLDSPDGLARIGSDTATSLAIYARQDPEDVYVQGELEANRQLMAAIKNLRRGLHLDVADGLSRTLLDGLTGRQKGRRTLSPDVRIPTYAADKLLFPRLNKGRQYVDSMKVWSPQSGPVVMLPSGQMELEIVEPYHALIPPDTKTIFGVLRIHTTAPGLRLHTSFEELKNAAGIKGGGGDVNERLWESLKRLRTWWYHDYDPDTGKELTFSFISGLERAGRGSDSLIIDVSLRLHEACTGRLYEDYIEERAAQLEGLSPQALGAYIAICRHREPRRWYAERVARAISSNQRLNKAKAEALTVLKELEDAGLLETTKPIPSRTGTDILGIVKTGETGRGLPWERRRR